jgi:hypothetical protein
MIRLIQGPPPESATWDQIVRFAAAYNLSLEAVASSSFRAIISHAFEEGFRVGSLEPNGLAMDAFRRYCPEMGTTSVRARLIHIATEQRKEQEKRLADVLFAAMTMDGGQVGPLKFFVTNVVASSVRCCFTGSITKVPALDHVGLRELLSEELLSLEKRGIKISAVICDGATFQTKALTFDDPQSIQSQHPDNVLLTRLLFMPCLCHRLNNAYHFLCRDCRLFGDFIRSLRALGKFCRRPGQRDILGCACPQFIETRWLYDQRILRFVLAHAETINTHFEPEFRVTALHDALAPLLEEFMTLVTELESSFIPLGRAYSLITSTIEILAESAAQAAPDVQGIYTRAISAIQRYTLDSTHDLIQLAYVLTPIGCECARKQLMNEIGTFQRRGSRRESGESDVDLPLASFVGQLADHGNVTQDDRSTVIERSVGRVPGEEEENDEDILEDDQPAVAETVILRVRNPGCPCTDLFRRARNGLERVIAQFRFNETERQEILAALDRLVTEPEAQLRLTRTADRERFCWLTLPGIHPEFTLLAEIALRLEPLTCSEAPSERTIGKQRRFLTPHRTRTNTDLLLARTEIEEFHHSLS